MKKIVIVCSTLALSATLTAHAQQGSARGQGGRGVTVTDPAGGSLPTYVDYWARPIETKAVKGRPYSAEVVTESVQTLADGNRIVHRTTGRVYRDSEGRVRREEDRPSGTPSVFITDPVAGKSFSLDPATRRARLTTPISPAVVWLKTDRLQLQPLPAGDFLFGYSDRFVPSAPGRAGRGGDWYGEKLPDRTIEGVLASGIRRTTTIATGAIGNEQPITIVSEEWTSPDLQVLVMTDLNDPRTGRSTYRLLKISRAEPDPALFRVPGDYTVQR